MFRHSAKGEVFAQQLMLLYCGMDLFNDVEVWILCLTMQKRYVSELKLLNLPFGYSK